MIPWNPYTIAALLTVLGAVFKIHLAVNVAGACTVSMFLPLLVLGVIVAAVVVLAALIWRELFSPARFVRSAA